MGSEDGQQELKKIRPKSGFSFLDLQDNPDLVSQIPDTDLDSHIVRAEQQKTRNDNRLSCAAKKYDSLRSTDTLKYYSICFPEETLDDLSSFLGVENVSKLDQKKDFEFIKEITTKHGNFSLNVAYRAKDLELYITLPYTQTTGLSMIIQLNEQNQPVLFKTIGDPNRFFKTLIYEAGYKNFVDVLGEDIHVWHFKKTVEYQQKYSQIAELLKTLSLNQIEIEKEYQNEAGFFVEQGHYKIAPTSVPLATAGMDTCSALVIIDQQQGKHYLAHIDNGTKPENILKSIQEFNLESSQIFILPGTTGYAGSVQQILLGLQSNESALKNIKFLHYEDRVKDGGVEHKGLTIKDGQLFLQPNNNDGWNTESDSFK